MYQEPPTPTSAPSYQSSLRLAVIGSLLVILLGVIVWSLSRAYPAPKPAYTIIVPDYTLQLPAGYQPVTNADLGIGSARPIVHFYYLPSSLSKQASISFIKQSFDQDHLPVGLVAVVPYVPTPIGKEAMNRALASYQAQPELYQLSSTTLPSGQAEIIKKKSTHQLQAYVARNGFPVFIMKAAYQDDAQFNALAGSLSTLHI